MKKLFCIAFLFFSSFYFVSAQEKRSKLEFFGGVSIQKFSGLEGDLFFGRSDIDRRIGIGINAAAMYRINEKISARFDINSHFRSPASFSTGIFINQQTGETSGAREYSKENTLSLQGGLQYKHLLENEMFRPFAHFLAGVSFIKNTGGTVFGLKNVSTAGPSVNIGGGLDIRLNEKIDIRAIQLAYNPVFTSDKTYTYDGPDLTYSQGTFSAGDKITVKGKVYNLFNIAVGVVLRY